MPSPIHAPHHPPSRTPGPAPAAPRAPRAPKRLLAGLGAVVLVAGTAAFRPTPATIAHDDPAAPPGTTVHYRTAPVQGLSIFYREAGPADAPTILLLHGFPSSSHMFRNLIPALADRYHVIAPDFPGFGQSSTPPAAEFGYTFDHLASVMDGFTGALGLTRFAMYVQDYGAPIGFRLAAAHPERITGLIIQNGNAYEDGLQDFWNPIRAYWADPSPEHRAGLAKFLEVDATRWQWTQGVRDPSAISPDTWTIDQAGLDRPGNKEIQLDLFLDYRSNPPLYPAWQAYFRRNQPPTLIVWGKNDATFPATGAEAYRRDLTNLDLNLLDTGHFALEEDGPLIAGKIRGFMQSRAAKP